MTLRQDQLYYERLMLALYNCKRGDFPGTNSEHWAYYQECRHYALKVNANNIDIEKFQNEAVVIKDYIQKGIEYKINKLAEHDSSIELDELLDYRSKLKKCHEYEEILNVVVKVHDLLITK